MKSTRPPKDPFDDDLPLDQKILIGLEQVGQAIALLFETESRKENLSALQMRIVLSLLEPHHPDTVGTLSREMGVTAPTVSDATRTLEKKAYLNKKRSEGDSRVVQLSLTSEGKRLARGLNGKRARLLEVIAGLSGDEKSTLLSVLIKLTRGLQDHGLISVSRMCVSCEFFKPNAYPGSEKPHHCGFVDAPFGEPELRLDCPEHIPAEASSK
ncbi:MAG: MarR family transcriptional regulator [Nitrospirae bacterium]|nr:MarR family transcriptional regulator [Candidatus Manganitrophaceae bacterium]